MCRIFLGAVALFLLAGAASAAPVEQTPWKQGEFLLAARSQSCKSVSSCEEAVAMWCGGYSRADGDNDGIPCENVCSSVSQVEAIKKDIGC